MSFITKEDNHKDLSLSDSVPYLLKFPEFYKIIEQSGDRYQTIEDIAWDILYSLDYNTAEGVWLDYIGAKVGQPRVINTRPDGAFMFNGTAEEGFGKGKFLGQGRVADTHQSRTDYTYRNAIKAKIIENSTDTSIDELTEAIKLLFNATQVRVVEEYPAGIAHIDIMGSNLIKPLDPISLIKRMLSVGVSLESVSYNSIYNIFANDAFIEYPTGLIPANNDFELSLIINPTQLDSENPTAILSQGNTWASIYTPVRLYYDPVDGVVFRTSPEDYSDTSAGTTFYNDENSNIYVDSDAEVFLNGGILIDNTPNSIKITRAENVWTLMVNNDVVDTEISNRSINTSGAKLYLGTSNAQFYNSGAIYNLLLEDKTLNTIIINDPLITDTIGTNNGVEFV